MLFWIWFCGVVVVVNICVHTVDMESLDTGVQTMDMKSLTEVAFSTKHYKDTMDNLILLTYFNARNKIQQICYERMNLMAVRSMVNKYRTFRQLNPDVVKVIQKLKIQKRRKRGRRGGGAKVVARNAPGFRYVNFSNHRQVTLRKGHFSDDTIKFWTKFGFGNVQSLKNKENLLRD